ncbi:HAMP domain-containing histidine kinase [Actinoplanes sp. LDG1-06]|uniref:histidine kinase n=1 Tax=Paractinoplanes ovalisporus TaxID=2810368 RepID=A0ABS2A8Y4_9ACTN|nr:HAMP domain-containing sensor histidine kinase [Actinoplanes ovalisporus]MBM2616288.1 HAMP domain-containing histidine kinase [Actinoplanes ovalisporus]
MNRPDPDRLLLSRARRTSAVQSTAVVTLILLVAGLVAAVALAREQRRVLETTVRQTAATAEDVVDPPYGMWLFVRDGDGRLSSTAGAPSGFPDLDALERAQPGSATSSSSVDRAGTDYLVVTQPRGTGAVQVVASMAGLEQERHRTLAALGVAGLIGLAAAAGAGWLLAGRATRPLGEALARQRRFVADAGHELRTPVTQLHTRAQLLHQDLHDGAPPDRMAADVEQLLAGARQLGEIIEDLLLSTRMEHDASEASEVDLGVVAAGAVAGFAAKAMDNGVSLVLDPDPDRPSLVRGREAALRRVVVALVDNALSHTASGGQVTVELRETPGRAVTLTVRDTGTGFDPADAERLFDRFARGHGEQRRFGLGLALAREVITGHGGTIEAAGEPGQGATFTVRLPAAPP